jgi:hypothetical protein
LQEGAPRGFATVFDHFVVDLEKERQAVSQPPGDWPAITLGTALYLRALLRGSVKANELGLRACF